ncbi:hypothetical protein CCH79_00015096, partial [Gambusia affinis]
MSPSVEGKPNSIFALKGSSVNLSCSAPRSAANVNWYMVSKDHAGYVYHNVSAHRNHEDFSFSEDHFTLTIRDLRECTGKCYCCSETTPKERPDETDSCQQNSIQLQVIDLQVKVFPASEGQKVTLMCSSSCPLTESPAAFIWYQDGEFLYEDWSPWYQELVSSDQAVRYSCAIKGYEDLRAPDVSVDSVSGSCFSVTYAEGTMCSYKSQKQSCSITFPTGVNGSDCWSVNYDSRRICGLKGSSVNISSKYSHPEYQQTLTNRWYKMKINTKQEEEVMENKTDVNYQNDTRNQHILRLNNLDEKNSGEYEFRMKTEQYERKSSRFPGVTLIVTGLLVDVQPAAEVTEGQRVTLTCSTSCPLSENTNYIWYLNSRPLSLTKTPNKHLIIDAVSRENEGNYSCSVETIHSTGKTLTINTDHMNEEFPAQPAEQELHYSQIALEKINPIYSSYQQHQEQEHVTYSV